MKKQTDKNPAAVALGSIKSDKKAAAARINGTRPKKPKQAKESTWGPSEMEEYFKSARASRLNGAKHKKRK